MEKRERGGGDFDVFLLLMKFLSYFIFLLMMMMSCERWGFLLLINVLEEL